MSKSNILLRLNWMQTHSYEDKNDDICYGTDLNRNWNQDWNERGTSDSPCSDYYAGPKAFSEPETKALSLFLEDNKKYINVGQFKSNDNQINIDKSNL